ncbi:ABC transporter ATP-binding protein [Candidatus Omnitrophota bacterium]
MKVVEFIKVSEKYRIKFVRKRKVYWEEIWVLSDINLKLDEAEVLGVIGQNGAGKTTFLKLIAGMLIPDKGEVKVRGKVSTLMELGAGFNPEFTGRENIVINSRIYGIDEAVLGLRIGEILEFADLGKFIDAPLKYYSGGMYMRLAFALAIFVAPDILLIDDILAVGDEEAQQRCIKKIFELKEIGKTIVIVSHDMRTINSLCDRTILLENGKVIKEGVTKEVTAFYIKGLLLKEKAKQLDPHSLPTISCGNYRLFADMEKKEIKLYAKNRELTKDRGLHTSFEIGKNWYDISSSEMQINNEGGVLLLKFFWKFFDLTQIWKLNLKENCLFWQVESRVGQALDFKHVKFGLFLSSGYKTFFCGYQQQGFPKEFLSWQNIPLEAPNADFFGVREQRNLPAVILENQQELSCVIQNSDKENSCRALQLNFPVQSLNQMNMFFSTKISLIAGEELVENYLKQEREKSLIKQHDKQANIRKLNSISSEDINLFSDPERKSLRISYKGREITSGSGLYSVLCVDQTWVPSESFQWRIHKVSQKELRLILDHRSLSILQIWTLICENAETIRIKIEFEVKKPVSVDNWHLILELKDGYKNWQTPYEQGDFLINHYSNNIGPIRLKDNKVHQVLLEPQDLDVFPNLNLDVISKYNKRIISLYKQEEKGGEEMVCINSSLIIPKKKNMVNPGKFVYFEGKIRLGKEIALRKKVLSSNEFSELKNDDLRFVFDSGRCKIIWRDKELTAGLGVYTSVRSKDVWHDSYQAAWRVNHKGNKKIVAVGYWPYLPISQTWQIELTNKGEIHWKVDMDVYEEADLEIEQANIMLLPKYKNWIVPDINKGEFTDEFTQNYDILPYRFWQGKANQIKATGLELPGVIFVSDSEDKNFSVIAENTDSLYQARLLQYQKENNTKVAPKQCNYFKGIIRIEPNE